MAEAAQWSGFCLAALLVVAGAETGFAQKVIALPRHAAAAAKPPENQPQKLPAWSELKKTLEKHFSELRGRQATDVLTASEAKGSLDALAKAGWKPKEESKLLARVPSDGDFLVRELRSREGRKFLNATSGEANVYDRLDRLTRYSGGDRLVSSVIRLPNGPAFMRPKPTPGFGTLMDLLPKGASGKTPIDRDFNKPTGKIYTAAQWIKELEAAHAAETKPAAPVKKPAK